MKPDETMYEWIDSYLKGQLEGEVLSSFTDRLESDQEFAALVQNHKAANTLILGQRLAMVKQMMDDDFKSKDTKNNSTKWGLGGLLGTSILIGSLLYISNKTGPEIVPNQASVTSMHKTVSDEKLSDSGQKDANTKLYKKYPEHLLHTDATNSKLPSTESQTDVTGNTSSDLQNQNQDTHKMVVDSSLAKNTLNDKHLQIQKNDPCQGVVIDGILNVDAACTNKKDGEIHIREQSIKGGKAPYTYVLINRSNDSIRQKATSFVSLAAGTYTLFFQDANTCLSAYKKPLYVNEKSCATSQSFSPQSGERFMYPVSGDSDTEIKIYNRSGQLVHKTSLLKSETEYWDGTNQNGQLLPLGMYIYIIEYRSGTKETGEVVIF